MKGLLKGFKYITQIFEEKEEEFEIGLPTDVKHVAHIGWDGPSTNNTPSWMNEFKSPENTDGISNGEVKDPSTKSSSQETLKTGEGIQDSLPRSRRQPSAGNDSPLDSPTRRSSEVPPKHSRRHRSSGGSTDSLTQHSRKQHNSNPGTESLSGDLTPVPKHSRRQQNSNLGHESLSGDITHVPKHSRRKKSKGSSGSISKSSRSKEQNSFNESLPFEEHGSEGSESRHSLMNNEKHLNSVLEECKGEGERR